MSDVLSTQFKNNYDIKNVFNILDYKKFDTYMLNINQYMIDKISNADINIFTNSNIQECREMIEKENTNKDEAFNYIDHFKNFKNRCSIINKINPASSIFIYEDLFKSKPDFINKPITNSDKEIIKFFAYIVSFFSIFILGINILNNKVLSSIKFPDSVINDLNKYIWVFISLLLQILPFILIGAIISGIIQVIIPSNRILKIFEKTSIKSLILSLFIGCILPVCDCAMVPIANSIVKRGYSIPVAITFLLASPAVNPIVIASTYYAFPNSPKIVVYRVLFGILVAFLIGIILMIMEKIKSKRGSIREFEKSIVKEDYDVSSINTDMSYDKKKISNISSKKTGEKIYIYLELIVQHCIREFFKISPYIILGCLVSTTIQFLIPKDVFIGINSVNIVSVIIMIIMSIFISICSTSNAFIARSFSNIMPLNSILAFMVTGPIIDITNLSVMTSVFKKKFVLKLVLMIIYISTIIFALMSGGIGII